MSLIQTILVILAGAEVKIAFGWSVMDGVRLFALVIAVTAIIHYFFQKAE